jgi:hypothetical protein
MGSSVFGLMAAALFYTVTLSQRWVLGFCCSLPPPNHGLHKVSEFWAFVKMCKQDPSILYTEEMCFLRE